MTSNTETRKPSKQRAAPLKLSTVVDITTITGGGARILLDGRQDDGLAISTNSMLGFPFDQVRVRGEYSFSTEVWVNGNLKFMMPRDSDWSRSVVQAMESGENPNPPFTIPEDANEWRELVDGLRKEMAQHDGAINHELWDRLDRMFWVHSFNFEDLRRFLAVALSEEVFLKEIMNQDADPFLRKQHLTKVDQHIHNFLASGYAMEQQATKLMKAYRSTEFGRRFQAKADELQQDGAVCFARDLRAFLTHQSLPFTQQTLTFTSEPNRHDFSIGLAVDELLLNESWREPSRKFIEKFNTKVEVLGTLTEAFQNEQKLWTWALEQADTLNKIQRTLANEVALELNWVLSQGSKARPRFLWAKNATL